MNVGKYFFTSLSPTFVAILLACTFASSAARDVNLEKLVEANNIFALNLHKALSTDGDKNVFFSPLSLTTVLSMLYYGVRGESAKELRQTLGYNDAHLTEESIHRSFHQLLQRISNSNTGNLTLKSANTILVDSHIQLLPEYKKNIQYLYMSSVRSVDFANDGQRIVEDVNGWVNDKTEGMIRRILNNVDPQTAIIMLNAVYFKGKWKNAFKRRATRREIFHSGGMSGSKNVEMMVQTSTRLPYTESSEFQAVELPYEGEELSMLVLLPNTKTPLSSLEQTLTTSKLQEILQGMSPRKLDLYLPKFTLEFQKDLSPQLESLGLHGIFNGGDFSGMTSGNDSNLSVSQVVHKCRVELNEEGTKAAAVTAVLIKKVSLMRNTVFRANHPFLFFIIDKVDGMILFMGRLSKL